jgi:hypothetical protein
MRVIGTVKSAIVRESKEKKTPSISIAFDLPTNPSGESVVYADLWLTEVCIDRTLDTVEKAFDVRLTNFDGDLEQLVNREASLVLEQEEYEGKYRWRVKWINAVGRKADPQLVEALNRRLASMGIVSKRSTPDSGDLPF